MSSLHFKSTSVHLKGRMGAAIAPSWATNKPYFKNNHKTYRMMTDGWEITHRPSTVLWNPTDRPCRLVLFQMYFGKKLDSGGYGNNKEIFPVWNILASEAIFGLCVKCKQIIYYSYSYYYNYRIYLSIIMQCQVSSCS